MKKLGFIALTLALAIFALPALAQTDEFGVEGLTDTDLTADIEAENLPTTDGFRYGWESFLYRIQRTFTFKAEHKAELDRARLHRLDRKLTACSEIGDEECVARIEERITQVEGIAQKHLDKYEELQEKFADRFEEWREKRDQRIQTLKEHAAERQVRQDDLIEEFKARREEAAQNREEHLRDMQERREELKESRGQTLEERQQNQEHLIEVRSDHLKKTLDNTRTKVEVQSRVRSNAGADVQTDTSVTVNGEQITEANDDN